MHPMAVILKKSSWERKCYYCNCYCEKLEIDSMLCSTGMVNEIIVDTLCKIIMFPLKQQGRSHPGEELARLVKRRLIKEGTLKAFFQLSRARASCFPWNLVNEHGSCLHFAQSAVAPFSWQGFCTGFCPSPPGLAGWGPEWLTCDLFHIDKWRETGLLFIMIICSGVGKDHLLLILGLTSSISSLN